MYVSVIHFVFGFVFSNTSAIKSYLKVINLPTTKRPEYINGISSKFLLNERGSWLGEMSLVKR